MHRVLRGGARCKRLMTEESKRQSERPIPDLSSVVQTQHGGLYLIQRKEQPE
jgi:hypothetical protein